MNDQQQIRADALTEAQRKALETAVNVLNINWEHETANELWEAFTAPVSQPAAAPADERAAFEDAFRAAHEFPEHADRLTFRKGWEAAIMWQRRARAASANETGAEGVEPMAVPAGWKLVRVNEHFDALIAALERAESKGYLPETMREEWENFAYDENVTASPPPAQAAEQVAQWQLRLKDRSSPVVDHWVNISPDGAKTLMEKYADVYEVRALYAAPQHPAQADAREGLTAAARATIVDACQSISRNADDLKECHTVDGDWGDDVDAKAFYDAELRLLKRLTALLAHPGQPEPADCGETLPGEYTNADDLIASLREPEPRAEVTDEQIADMFERVTGYSIENGRAALNEADILGFARELLEAARAGDAS
ncbi:hypothetical protein [Burkholderia multivorans]|uniref:hypothetical protein n=1 Tax=Burkholderia multivorans TaxID=87883 RepID=UPI000CFE568B|nr:hypothetical protein [Burkholderia multivorans]PRG18002.1 hypothetical protein C6T62_28945 [Burkholderia multivorans]